MSTKTIVKDGHREIVLLLSPGELTTWRKDDPLSYERSVLWLEDVERLPYVRVATVRCAKSRRGPLTLRGKERVVGYSKLMDDAPRDPHTALYTRRLFYVKDEDTSPSGPPPSDTVDPRTVLPGAAGTPPRLNAELRSTG